jgi:hypothetical protein
MVLWDKEKMFMLPEMSKQVSWSAQKQQGGSPYTKVLSRDM